MLNIPASVLNYRDTLWLAACKENGTDASSKFVVFADDNVAAKHYNSFMVAFFRAIQLVKDTGSSVLIYRSTLPLSRNEYGAEFTLPTWGERIGDRIMLRSNLVNRHIKRHKARYLRTAVSTANRLLRTHAQHEI
jgi:hypothetical protein